MTADAGPRLACSTLSAVLAAASLAPAAASAAPASTDRPELKQGLDNKPERLEWFRDLGFGMFIHWSVDSQIGSVISHSLAGASEDYRKRFFEDLPRTFNPRKFDPEDWAALAKLAGMKYVVFTTKHHSGFAMWNTRTTPFNVMRTPGPARPDRGHREGLPGPGDRRRLLLFARGLPLAAHQRQAGHPPPTPGRAAPGEPRPDEAGPRAAEGAGHPLRRDRRLVPRRPGRRHARRDLEGAAQRGHHPRRDRHARADHPGRARWIGPGSPA